MNLATLHKTAPSRIPPSGTPCYQDRSHSRPQYTHIQRDRSHSTHYGHRHETSPLTTIIPPFPLRQDQQQLQKAHIMLPFQASQWLMLPLVNGHSHLHLCHDTSHRNSCTPSHTSLFSHICHSCHSLEQLSHWPIQLCTTWLRTAIKPKSCLQQYTSKQQMDHQCHHWAKQPCTFTLHILNSHMLSLYVTSYLKLIFYLHRHPEEILFIV